MIRLIRRTVLTLSILPFGGCHFDGISGAAGDWRPGIATHDVAIGGLNRRYDLRVPLKRPTTAAGLVRPYWLVIVLHGSSGSSDEIRQTTGMDSLAEAGRFIVAYPQGLRGAGGLFPSDWNAGTCCGAAGRENIDDVGFIDALITDVGKHLAVDKRRVYVAGFSDGGRMAHRLGCKLSPAIAAIAVVSGSLKDDSCAPAKPVPLLAIHGTSDDQVAYDEPASTPPSAPQAGIAATLPQSIQFWVAKDACTGAKQERPTTHVVRTSFTTCTGGEVTFYTIEGGTHAWPGDTGGAGSQPPMSELPASRTIVAFFGRQYRR